MYTIFIFPHLVSFSFKTMYRLTLVKRGAITNSKRFMPCTQHIRGMAQRPADLEHEEYKPWANENSTCGTTRETVDRRVASDNCVDAEKELNEDREESEVNLIMI